MTRKWLILLAVVAVTAAACSSVVDNATEQIVERAIESQGDGDVNVDLSDDGSVSFSVEGEDGNSLNFGVDVPIPDELTIPVPDGGKATTSGTDASYVFVALTYPMDRFDELVAFYDEWTAGTGEDWARSQSTLDLGEETMRSNTWTETATAISVTDCFSMEGDADSLDATCVTINESS